MKPIAIFRHARTEGPGYLATYLERAQIAWQLVPIDEGAAVPSSPDAFSGLVFMGGPMSVNDDLPWIPPVLQLIRDAVARDVPVLGHCLGGQLMSKALGGVVSRTVSKEIGWGEVRVAGSEPAQAWFGSSRPAFVTFHWHGETFSIPRAAMPVLSSPLCQNQGFALGPQLGLQCHIEMTDELVRSWCDAGRREIGRGGSPGVQSVAAIVSHLPERLGALHEVADTVYGRWIQGLKR
ncbi:MAG: type 1 glutamine amidotransferase [Burkholderiales bacterium]|nr:type 1 glutamine amidotransferase [Burkholderiales bacterium]